MDGIGEKKRERKREKVRTKKEKEKGRGGRRENAQRGKQLSFPLIYFRHK